MQCAVALSLQSCTLDLCLVPEQGLGMLTGKYDAKTGRLPKGPRSVLFRQILPGIEPLLGAMRAIADERGKTASQVGPSGRLHGRNTPS